MKAKLKTPYSINENETIAAGAECHILDAWCGTDGSYYFCDFGKGRKFSINGKMLEITDRSPIVNWDQVRIQLSGAALQGLLSNSNLRYQNPEECAKEAVMAADALIEELKRNPQ